MTVAAVGQIVHYVSHGTPPRPDGSQAFASECRAAVVAGAEDGKVTLCVLNPSGIFFNEAAHDDAKSGGSWHFPEHVPGTRPPRY